MSKEDNTGKMEVAVRILGNELVALKNGRRRFQNEMVSNGCNCHCSTRLGCWQLWTRTNKYVRRINGI